MIKTQTKEENKFMKRILPHYYKFVTENPHTMLVRILGTYGYIYIQMYVLKKYFYLYPYIYVYTFTDIHMYTNNVYINIDYL
jgi:hypothetical protein